MYEIFERLCQERGVTAYRVSKETGVNAQTFSAWKRGVSSPKAEKLQKIATYFGVPVETFTGAPDATPERLHLTPEESALVTAYRAADSSTQTVIRRALGL